MRSRRRIVSWRSSSAARSCPEIVTRPLVTESSPAMKGADAVISTLGAKGSVIGAAARAIVAGAKQEGPHRIVMLSTFAVARDRLKAASKLLTGMAMGPQIKDKTAGEEALRASGLDWTNRLRHQADQRPQDRTYGRP